MTVAKQKLDKATQRLHTTCSSGQHHVEMFRWTQAHRLWKKKRREQTQRLFFQQLHASLCKHSSIGWKWSLCSCRWLYHNTVRQKTKKRANNWKLTTFSRIGLIILSVDRLQTLLYRTLTSTKASNRCVLPSNITSWHVSFTVNVDENALRLESIHPKLFWGQGPAWLWRLSIHSSSKHTEAKKYLTV